MIQSAINLSKRAEIDDLYTPLPVALDELRRRRADIGLVGRVQDYHAALPPFFLPREPVTLLFRSIVSATHELDRFLCLIKKTGISPLLVEYKSDSYVSCNRDKYRLCRLLFDDADREPRGLKVVDLSSLERTRPSLQELRAKNGILLSAFHHTLVAEQYPGLETHIVDFSDWFSKASDAEFYYLRYLSLFVCQGILFENFLYEDEAELEFVRQRVIPSFEKVTEMFGVRPLIVSLLPFETEGSDFWRSLPLSLYGRAQELISAKA